MRLKALELVALIYRISGVTIPWRLSGKGNRRRTIYLNDACVDAIKRYLSVRLRRRKGKKALFISRQNNRKQ